jgi:outer membrane lipoprotein-sorting protein
MSRFKTHFICYTSFAAALTLALCVMATRNTSADDKPQKPAPVTVEQQHKNIQVLKGMPESQLVPAMNFISTSLGVRCNYCHVNKGDTWDFVADTKPEKSTAREMIKMVQNINKTTFKGTTEVSCYSCHRGRTRVSGLPALPVPAVAEQPAASGISTRPQLPTIEALLSKYEESLGGAAALAQFKTRVMKGSYTTTNGTAMPYEVYQSTPGKYHSVIKTPRQVVERVFDGTSGWVKNSAGVNEIKGDQLFDFKRFVDFFRDIKLREQFSRMTVAGKEKIDDRDVYVVRAGTADGARERLFFDAETGLLVRRIIYIDSMIGIIPEQIDFSDYRVVDGMKLPFTVKNSSVDPYSSGTRTFSEIRINVAVDDSNFRKP